MASAASKGGTQRGIALALLLLVGILSLPVVAALLDGGSTEAWIIPVQLAFMAAVGAVVGRRLPGLGGPDSSARRSAGVGAVVGIAMGIFSVALFYVLL